MVTGSPGFCAQLVKAHIVVSVNITIYATHQLLTSSIVMTMKGIELSRGPENTK